jgi:hypothetical protein
MTAGNFVFICCSPHKRVGTSTSARILSDYFLATGRPFLGFDTDPHEPDYAVRFPERVKTVDLNAVKGQVALIDGLLSLDGEPKIVDLWSRSFDRFFTLIKDIGFIEEARKRGVEPVFLYHADAAPASAATAWRLAENFAKVEWLLAHNEGAAPLGDAAEDILGRFPPHRRLRLCALDPLLGRALEPVDLSLAALPIEPPPDMSIVVRAGLRAWLSPIFSQWRSFELRHALDNSSFLA